MAMVEPEAIGPGTKHIDVVRDASLVSAVHATAKNLPGTKDGGFSKRGR
jgi:hypothetical protein